MSCFRGRFDRSRGGWGASVWFLVGAALLFERGAEWPAAILAIVGVSRLIPRLSDPTRGVRGSILRDAREHGVAIPRDEVVWDGLFRLYALYGRTSRTYTQLAGQYAEIIDSMWVTLKMTHDLRDWRRIVGSVVVEWPTPYGSGESPLNASLAKGKTAARKWQEAHREAHHWS